MLTMTSCFQPFRLKVRGQSYKRKDGGTHESWTYQIQRKQVKNVVQPFSTKNANDQWVWSQRIQSQNRKWCRTAAKLPTDVTLNEAVCCFTGCSSWLQLCSSHTNRRFNYFSFSKTSIYPLAEFSIQNKKRSTITRFSLKSRLLKSAKPPSSGKVNLINVLVHSLPSHSVVLREKTVKSHWTWAEACKNTSLVL